MGCRCHQQNKKTPGEEEEGSGSSFCATRVTQLPPPTPSNGCRATGNPSTFNSVQSPNLKSSPVLSSCSSAPQVMNTSSSTMMKQRGPRVPVLVAHVSYKKTILIPRQWSTVSTSNSFIMFAANVCMSGSPEVRLIALNMIYRPLNHWHHENSSSAIPYYHC